MLKVTKSSQRMMAEIPEKSRLLHGEKLSFYRRWWILRKIYLSWNDKFGCSSQMEFH